MRAQVFLQFLPGLVLRSDEQVEPPAIELLSERAAAELPRPPVRYSSTVLREPALLVAADSHASPKGLARRVKERPDFERTLAELDESLHPLLRAAMERGFSEFAAPFELVGPNGVEGDVEVAWPEARIGLYFDHQRDMAQRLERDGWRLLAIESRPNFGQLLQLLEGA